MDRIIPFSSYMEYCLYSKKIGYYFKKERIFGKKGDFYTPQVASSLFGKVLAEIIKKDGFREVYEFGAGDGHLAFDILSSNFQIDRYIIYEISKKRRKNIKKRLVNFKKKVELHQSIEGVQEIKGFVIMVEFVDAFPVKRFFKKGDKIYEVWVDIHKRGEILKELENYEFLKYYDFLPEGYYFEYPFSFINWFKNFSKNFKKGKILIIDYGLEKQNLISYPEGTIRGFKDHRIIKNIYEFLPGEIDITHTPDFSFLKEVFQKNGFKIKRFSSLSKFLIEEGILDIFEREISIDTNSSFKIKKHSELKTLITPGMMGEKYLVMEMQK